MDFSALFANLNKVGVLIVIGGFMPLSLISFLNVMLQKKSEDFEKAKNQMGLTTSRSVGQSYSFGRFVLPVTFATIITLFGAVGMVFTADLSGLLRNNVVFSGVQVSLDAQEVVNPLAIQSFAVAVYAFLGSFLWSANVIVRRVINMDLQPNVYYSAGLRIIFACVLAVALSFLVGNSEKGQVSTWLQSSLPALAILAGTFPESVMNYFINFFQDYIKIDPLNTEVLSLEKIEGMTLAHRERIAEANIDNAQNLASASLSKLMIETPYDARTLIDWIGQAKLLCYAKKDIEKYHQLGLRTVFDFLTEDKTPEKFVVLADAVEGGVKAVVLENVWSQIVADDGIKSLNNFYLRLNDPHKNYAETERKIDKSAEKEV